MTGATLPLAAQPFVAFASLLRANGFAVAPEQTTAFLSAIALLGPRSLHDVRSAAHALFAPPPERHDEFNALFDAHFLGAVELGREIGEPDPDDLTIQEDRRGGFEPPSSDDINEAGQAATAVEALSVRRFAEADETDALRRFRRAAPERLPLRRGYRRVAAKHGRGLDLRRAMKEAIRNDGEIFRLPRLIPQAAPPQHSPAHRRVGLDEGPHRAAPALRPRPGAIGGAHRGLHHRHAAHARHQRPQTPQPRSGARDRVRHSSPTGTAARASAMPCRRSSPSRASPATRAAPSC